MIVKTREGDVILRRDVSPLEGTNASLWGTWNPIENWWTENGLLGGFTPGNGVLAERTWITNRCLQMNSQQIGSMPLRFNAPNVAAGAASVEPAWVANPDPVYYPNGISSLIRAGVRDYYGWGYVLFYVTSRYANGYPRTFTRVPASRCEPMWNDERTRIIYPTGSGKFLDPNEVIQIDRDCGDGWSAHGTSAIRSYAQLAWGLQAAGNQAMEVNTGGVPQSVLRVTDPNKKVDSTQAGNLKTQWNTARQNTGPAVLPFGLDFTPLGWNPKDMALLETQDFNALALATAFGMPAILVNMTVGGGRGNSALTYQTVAQAGEQWWRFELRPTAKGIADALSSQALPAGQWVWFEADDTFIPYETSAGPVATAAENDPQAANSQVPAAADASPAQRPLSVVGGVTR